MMNAETQNVIELGEQDAEHLFKLAQRFLMMDAATQNIIELGQQDAEHLFKIRGHYNSMPCFEKHVYLDRWLLSKMYIAIGNHKAISNVPGDTFDILKSDVDSYKAGFISRFQQMYWTSTNIHRITNMIAFTLN